MKMRFPFAGFGALAILALIMIVKLAMLAGAVWVVVWVLRALGVIA